MSKRLIVIGGPGNGGVIASCVEDNRRRFGNDAFEMYGWLNDFKEAGEEINGYPVLGPLSHVGTLLEDADNMFAWAIHVIGRGLMRERLFADTRIPPDRLATIVHESAFVASNAVLEPGSFVMANSYVGPGTRIGQATLVMANCVIGHDNNIGPFNHISAGSTVSSVLRTGKFVDICLGATVVEKITLGDYSVVGAGALVLKDVPPREVHIGSPARFQRTVRED